MHVELVRALTSDGVYLHGALYPAKSGRADRLGLDAVLCLHGVASNFYGSGVLETLAATLNRDGVDVLRVNTRGHDGLTSLSTTLGSKPGGAAYEVVDECRLDVHAWISFLLERNYRRLGLFGHSLGAIKAIYHQTHQPHDAVRCVVAMSPPRLSHQAFMNSDRQPLYFQTIDEAQGLVHQGRGVELMSVRFPFPMHISAACYLDKYGPSERYNITNFAQRLQQPALFTYGSRELEAGVAFAGLPEALAGLRREDQTLDVLIVPEADHLYRQCEQQVSDQISQWLAAQLND